MVTSLKDTTILHNGVKMPWLGLGVWKVKDHQIAVDTVKKALQVGYRSIDTAAIYKNEEGVGQALKETDVPREEIFVTTKVWNTDQGYDSTLKAFEVSRKKLGLDYIDLYLIHWPVEGTNQETWRALETLYKEGKVRAIGVCNHHPHHLNELLQTAEIKPMINQVELHPKLNQMEVREFCKQHGIQVEAWSPLMKGEILNDPTLVEIGEKYSKSPAQVILRWDLQNEIVTIPKSVTPHRIEQNADVFDFELSKEDIEQINRLNENKRVGPDPDNFDFGS